MINASQSSAAFAELGPNFGFWAIVRRCLRKCLAPSGQLVDDFGQNWPALARTRPKSQGRGFRVEAVGQPFGSRCTTSKRAGFARGNVQGRAASNRSTSFRKLNDLCHIGFCGPAGITPHAPSPDPHTDAPKATASPLFLRRRWRSANFAELTSRRAREWGRRQLSSAGRPFSHARRAAPPGKGAPRRQPFPATVGGTQTGQRHDFMAERPQRSKD